METSAQQQDKDWQNKVADKLALIPDILKTVNNTNSKVTELSKTIDFVSGRLEETVKELDQVKKENMEMKISHSNLQKEMHKLKQDLLYLEAQSRRSNLLFAGFKEEDNENCEKIIKNFIEQNFGDYFEQGDDLIFERVHRVGPKSPNNQQRQIIAKFNKFKHRDLIWQNRFQLQKTPIWISEDYPQTVKVNREKLLPFFKAAKRSPLISSSSLRLDQLYINKKLYTVDTIKDIPAHLHPETSSIISTPEVVVFASKYAVLSNLYQCNIRVEGKNYNSTEQYIQYCKAVLFNDQMSAQKIMQETETFKIMQLGKKIRQFNKKTWQDRVHNIMRDANLAKFQQHENAKEVLLVTGNKTVKLLVTHTLVLATH
jgi:ribA/ribD-fused uncharacterized protein